MLTSPPMQTAIIPVTPFQQNCSIIWCTKTMKGAVVDPGGNLDRILMVAAEKQVTIEKILITHGHRDHAGGTAELAEKLGVPIEGPHIDDKFWIDKLDTVEEKPGFDATKSFTPDRWLEGHDTVTLGDLTLDVRHCPGHTPGHVIFFHEPSQLAIVGDVIFRGSVGRSDLERGDHDTLVKSIQEQLWPLGDEVIFLPGHGRLSTFGQEREDNPFVGDAVLGNRFAVSDPDEGPKMGPSFDA